MLTTLFILSVVIVNLFLAIIWATNNFVNTFLKMYFIISVVIGVYILLS